MVIVLVEPLMAGFPVTEVHCWSPPEPIVGSEPSGHCTVTIPGLPAIGVVLVSPDVAVLPFTRLEVTPGRGVVVACMLRKDTSRVTPWKLPIALLIGAALNPEIAANWVAVSTSIFFSTEVSKIFAGPIVMPLSAAERMYGGSGGKNLRVAHSLSTPVNNRHPFSRER